MSYKGIIYKQMERDFYANLVIFKKVNFAQPPKTFQ